MSRLEHFWRQARARLRADYREQLAALELAEVPLAIDEFEDVPDGDYLSPAAVIAMEQEMRSRHHRGKRRSMRVRLAEAQQRWVERSWNKLVNSMPSGSRFFLVSPGDVVDVRIDYTKGSP